MSHPRFRLSLLAAVLGATAGMSSTSPADVIEWANGGDEILNIFKPYDDSTASFTVDTVTNGVTFTLGHQSTSSGMDSASQWNINRWPVAPLFHESTGNFQISTNENNDVVLGLYGFYGDNGFDGTTPPNEITQPQIGDAVSYTLSLDFDTPVRELGFEVNGINALGKSNGFNSNDALLVEAFLGDTPAASPSYSSEGPGFIRTGDLLEGNWDHQIGLANDPPYVEATHHVTNEGSVRIEFSEPVDRVDLTLTNTAEFPNGTFLSGFDSPNTPDTQESLQTWSFSVGDVGFTTIPEPSTASFLLGAGMLFLLRRTRKHRV